MRISASIWPRCQYLTSHNSQHITAHIYYTVMKEKHSVLNLFCVSEAHKQYDVIFKASCSRKVKKKGHRVSTASLPTRTPSYQTKRFCAPYMSGFSATYICEIPQTKTLLRRCRQKEKRVNIMQNALVYASRRVAVHSLSSSRNPDTEGASLTSPLHCNLCVIRQIHEALAGPGASAS